MVSTQRRELFVKIPPGCMKQRYRWWNPPEIPKHFEDAATDILNGVAKGGEYRYKYVSQLFEWYHYIPKVGQSHLYQMDILGWAREKTQF